MNTLKSFLPKLLFRSGEFCCLCLKTVDTNIISFDDEVILAENEAQKNIKISEVLLYVLGDEVFNEISTLEDICVTCAAQAVNTYKFVRNAKDNIEKISWAVDYITVAVNEATFDESCDSLYMSLNPELTTYQYYCSTKPNTKLSEALKTDLKTDIEVTKKSNFVNSGKSKSKIKIREMLYETNDPSTIKCKECFGNFETLDKLKKHYTTQHASKISKSNNENNFMCAKCGKTFSRAEALKTHEKSHSLRFVCQECGRIYKNINTYRKHFKNNICQMPVRHSPADAKFTCDYCQKKYTQKITLRVHIQYEHLNYKWHLCQYCPKKFWCQSRLRAHMVKHTKEKHFPCKICNKKFVTKESVLHHTRLHTGEKPYACHLCDMKFLCASRRSTHIKNVHENPELKCDICHCKFKSMNYLLRHFKQMHGNTKLQYEIMNVGDINEEEYNKQFTVYKRESIGACYDKVAAKNIILGELATDCGV